MDGRFRQVPSIVRLRGYMYVDTCTLLAESLGKDRCTCGSACYMGPASSIEPSCDIEALQEHGIVKYEQSDVDAPFLDQ
jgi:hypothetical protein